MSNGPQRPFYLAGRYARTDRPALPSTHCFDCPQPHLQRPWGAAQVVAANTASRQEAAREAEALLQEEQRDFESWRDSLATVPTIKVRPLARPPRHFQGASYLAFGCMIRNLTNHQEHQADVKSLPTPLS